MERVGLKNGHAKKSSNAKRRLPNKDPAYWTIDELAERWFVSAWTVRRWIEEERLTAARLAPNTLRISHDEVRRFEQEATDA